MATNNSVEVQLEDGRRVCFSYGVPVAACIPGVGLVKTSRRYSVTTSKHANAFMGGKDRGRELPDEEFRKLITPLQSAE